MQYGFNFPFLPTRLSPFGKRLHGVEPEDNTFYICFGRITVYYGKYRKPGRFVLNSSLKDFGDIYVSALTILQSAMQFASVPLTGFAQGFVPIVSYNYGHGDKQTCQRLFPRRIDNHVLIQLTADVVYDSFPLNSSFRLYE